MTGAPSGDARLVHWLSMNCWKNSDITDKGSKS